MIVFEIDSIINAKEQYIAFPCNCTSISLHEKTEIVFYEKFSFANLYFNYEGWKPSRPGSIHVCYNYKDNNGPNVINMFTKAYPGEASKTSDDNDFRRFQYFKSCVNTIFRMKDLKSIAFPYNLTSNDDYIDDYIAFIQTTALKREDILVKIYCL